MISLPAGTNIWIAAGVTDLRRGFTGLSAIVQLKLEQDPFAGHVFVFRGRRGDLVKVLSWDGDGLCLFCKRLERGRFVWPRAESGAAKMVADPVPFPASVAARARTRPEWRHDAGVPRSSGIPRRHERNTMARPSATRAPRLARSR
jgi:transposase